MSKPVRLDGAAGREIEAAAVWYEERHPGLGIDLLAETEAAKQRLVATPSAWPRVPGVPVELDVRRCQVHRFPYSLVFVELADHLRVLAFAHVRRRPGYWRRRLRVTRQKPQPHRR
ncbi:MAG: type II toxin-antitoxin system RelE/ParE family toxin [Deltaproteobacteria bacterium]|nr:type II toxin-antitoxin system RelE/ParE family toxin [Deltaproteobacteria bacterium]